MLESSLLLVPICLEVLWRKLGEGARVLIGVGVVAAGLDKERFLVGVRESIVDSVFANILLVVNGTRVQRGYAAAAAIAEQLWRGVGVWTTSSQSGD